MKILNMYAPKLKSFKIHATKLTELQTKIKESTIFGDLNIPITVINQ